MTDEQKLRIRNLRGNNVGYVRIARMLGISENTVRSYCRRNEMTWNSAPKDEMSNVETEKHFCKCCGKPVRQNPGRKEKKFCSDKCRMSWWNSHPESVRRKSAREIVCPTCGKRFFSYESGRKYCCHDCYVVDRFGGDSR
ncbi:MAG: RNA polymerase subunit sigma-70 [Firmicutes bacterium]|nr:RNA polymerase subunit sigma-70 [Bacillota bacterium]